MIQKYIINYAQNHPNFSRQDVYKHLQKKYSKGYISENLTELVEQGSLIRQGSGKYTTYITPQQLKVFDSKFSKKYKNNALEEDVMLRQMKKQTPSLESLPENIQSILDYSFTEMTNNAIEHSQSKYIKTTLKLNPNTLTFVVRDWGIGVFRNIKQEKDLKNETAAIQELLKGKQTTQPKLHSGEGIFFTSKIADTFILDSYNYRLKVDNTIPDIFIEELEKPSKGTKVSFHINQNSDKHLIDVFEKYQSENGEFDFSKTEIKIKLYTLGSVYISRSQARRVLTSLHKFNHIIFDFDQVPTVGQAFADEIFRVFASKYPHITLEATNINKAVNFMISRVDRPDNVKLEG